MNSFATKLKFWKSSPEESSGDEIYDEDAKLLSPLASSIHDVLRKHHNRHHHTMWNVTTGSVISSVHQTPSADKCWDCADDPSEAHSNWFPEKMGELIGRTRVWCDVTSLGPPDGQFMDAFKKGLATIADNAKDSEHPVIVRMMFGNIAGMPVNCSAVIKALTADLPPDANVQLWVGAWRKGFSWNHSKLIAVDGVYLHTGGHNLWDAHYLTNNPVHDLSIEFEGRVAKDGHEYADQQWGYVERKQETCVGSVVDKMPDGMPLVLKSRVTVSEWPEGKATTYPPRFSKEVVADVRKARGESATDVPLISIGRQGTMVKNARPSDDAILAMINNSQTIIRMTLQDLGPVCVPGSKKALPGLKWPKAYLAAIGKAIYERGVDVEIILSNPNSIPGGLKGTEANYGNGWDCVDVAAEIIKRIQKQYKKVDDEKLRAMICDNLRICFVRHAKNSKYADGKNIGLHSKHFIVDDQVCYIGSQNLYMCDLAEWGVVIDSETQVKRIKEDYFDVMWKNSYTGEDVDVQKVMDGLKVDRDGKTKYFGKGEGAALGPHGAGAFYEDTPAEAEEVEEDTAIEVEDGEMPVVTRTETEKTEEREATPPPQAAESKDASETPPDAEADPEPAPSPPPSEPDVAAGSIAPEPKVTSAPSTDERTAQGDEEETVDKTMNETLSEFDRTEYTKTDVETKEEQNVEVQKSSGLDCNWCGMGEALNINK